MAEHGTRTMYVHYGCRCEACCRAEHEQYLKRPEAKKRKRTYSKWGDIESPARKRTNSERNAERWRKVTANGDPIHWSHIAERHGMSCSQCGAETDPDDWWTNGNGRKCFGRSYPTVDHIVPLSKGGSDTWDNVRLTCKRCNSAKGTKDMEEVTRDA